MLLSAEAREAILGVFGNDSLFLGVCFVLTFRNLFIHLFFFFVTKMPKSRSFIKNGSFLSLCFWRLVVVIGVGSKVGSRQRRGLKDPQVSSQTDKRG